MSGFLWSTVYISETAKARNLKFGAQIDYDERYLNKKLIRKWDSERELSLRQHRTLLQNTIDSCINSATDRRGGNVLERNYQIQWNNAMQRPLRRSRSFKVTDFVTNGKLIFDFLLMINSNLPPILHRFQVMVQFSLARGESLTLTLSLGVIPCQYRHKWYITIN